MATKRRSRGHRRAVGSMNTGTVALIAIGGLGLVYLISRPATPPPPPLPINQGTTVNPYIGIATGISSALSNLFG